MTRRIFIGDIQGCRIELERLLEKLRFDPAGDRLEPVGDLVNRGPDSAGCLRLLRDLGAGGVLGNHDLHLLRRSAGTRKARRDDTFDDVLAAEDREELCEWLAAKPLIDDLGDVLLVHAGIHPSWDDPVRRLSGKDPYLRDEDTDFATRVRFCDAEGRRPERDDPPPPAPFRPWFEHPLAWDPKGRRLVFGHWAQRGLVDLPGLRGLDTGCVWGGRLTAWIAEEDRCVDVPAERAWAAIGE